MKGATITPTGRLTPDCRVSPARHPGQPVLRSANGQPDSMKKPRRRPPCCRPSAKAARTAGHRLLSAAAATECIRGTTDLIGQENSRAPAVGAMGVPAAAWAKRRWRAGTPRAGQPQGRSRGRHPGYPRDGRAF